MPWSATMPERQQVLRLWLLDAALDQAVGAWSFHDGTGGAGPPLPDGQPPYATGVDALEDGWMLIQVTPTPPPPSDPHAPNAYIDHEFIFERRIEIP